ncbi:F-box domain containing protein [Acanthamoeba castellanii str. Neff]|uniref:F-box domain containing protein n=1 Tax=Acanthamoeba castellanii (strain ATCC 30010 / Neff) TaxID=1257118 RepID=L8HD60_ACACF|nr:F-box domain containing protein [Acanthamoeba castellanii str. Neff]ELR23167.1 F-box domain containing protein [Acanthamoeba castellanii str. Neff]
MELMTPAGPRLPPEMWAHIFSFFSARDIGRLALVCSAWRITSENDELWRPGFAASGGPDRAAWLDLCCTSSRRRAAAAAAHGDLGDRPLTKSLWGELAPVEGNWAGGLCDVTVTGMPRGRPVECMVIDEAHGRLILGTKGGSMELLDLPGSRTHVNDDDDDDEDEENEAKQHRARGAMVRRLRSAHSGPVRTLQLSPDGLLLASATARAAHLWDAKALESRPALSGGGPIMAFVPHSPSASTNILLSASAFGTTMRVWDAHDANLLHSLTPPNTEPLSLAIASVAIEPTIAAVGYASGGICVFSLETGQLLQQLLAHNGYVTCMQLQPGVLISGSGKPAQKFDAGHVNSILLHGPDQEQIISGSDDRTVRLWSRAQGKCIQTLADDSVMIHAMQKKHFATQPTAILTGEGPHIRLWNLDSQGLRHLWCESRPGTQDISSLAATTRFIAAATWDARVALYDFEGSSQSIRPREGHGSHSIAEGLTSAERWRGLDRV